MIRCELVTPSTTADNIWNEWRQTADEMPKAKRLFSADWHQIWAETWGTTGKWTGQVQIVVARDENARLQGMLFLGRPKVGPLTVRAMGGHDVPHRGILAVRDQEEPVGKAIGDFIAKQHWPLLQLGPIRQSAPADQAMIKQLKHNCAFLQLRGSREEISLLAPDSFEEYRTEVLGGKFYRKIGYYERRMARAGRVSIRHYRQPTDQEVCQMISDLNTIEAASWMTTRGTGIPRFTNPDLRHFWSEMILRYLSPEDRIDCWVMSLHDKPVSFCFTLNDGQTRYVIANQYDNHVQDHRTGSTLYRYMLEEGIERGIQRFEFGDGDLHYKSLWGAKIRDYSNTWLAIPNRVAGFAASLIPQRPKTASTPDGVTEGTADIHPLETATATSSCRNHD
jgi:hypothetical protein